MTGRSNRGEPHQREGAFAASALCMRPCEMHPEARGGKRGAAPRRVSPCGRRRYCQRVRAIPLRPAERKIAVEPRNIDPPALKARFGQRRRIFYYEAQRENRTDQRDTHRRRTQKTSGYFLFRCAASNKAGLPMISQVKGIRTADGCGNSAAAFHFRGL